MTQHDAHVLAADIARDLRRSHPFTTDVAIHGLEALPTRTVGPRGSAKEAEWCVLLVTGGPTRYPLFVRSRADWNQVKAYLAN